MRAASPPTLDRRALNRALLARQHLLARVEAPALAEVGHLAGQQAQNPLDPYYGLWSRLAGFDPAGLGAAVAGRAAVRLAVMRSTLHLLTAQDAATWRPLFQPLLERVCRSQAQFRRAAGAVDLPAVLAAAREWLEEAPRTQAELRALLAPRHEGVDPAALAAVVVFHLPVLQGPPRGVWGTTGPARWVLIDRWVDAGPDSADPAAATDGLVRRYLGALGPASVQDFANWSRLTGAAAKVARVRDGLVAFRHPDTGRELLDLPDAPRPDPGTSAPPRFLPEYDNVLLGHADRSRIAAVTVPPSLLARSQRWLLVDGRLAGCWTLDREPDRARLVVQPLTAWTDEQRDAVAEEGTGLLAFAAPDADHEVDLLPRAG